MKLVRYGEFGAEKPGIIDEQGNIRDLTDIVPDISGDVLSDEGLAKLKALDFGALPKVEGEPRIGACVGNIGKFACIGLNYSDHAAEDCGRRSGCRHPLGGVHETGNCLLMNG